MRSASCLSDPHTFDALSIRVLTSCM
jgi:hypothetical protein